MPAIKPAPRGKALAIFWGFSRTQKSSHYSLPSNSQTWLQKSHLCLLSLESGSSQTISVFKKTLLKQRVKTTSSLSIPHAIMYVSPCFPLDPTADSYVQNEGRSEKFIGDNGLASEFRIITKAPMCLEVRQRKAYCNNGKKVQKP